jgi:hypothetical protein
MEWRQVAAKKNTLINYLRFYVPLKNISLQWRRHHCRWRAAKFRPMLGAQGFWAGRDLYRSTPPVIRDLGFSGLIRRTAPFSRLLRHTRGCGGPILTRILTGAKKKYRNTGRSILFFTPSQPVCIKSLYLQHFTTKTNNIMDGKGAGILKYFFLCKISFYIVSYWGQI